MKRKPIKMSNNTLVSPNDLEKLFKHIDANKARYIDVLREAVAIKSVSASPDCRPEVFKMIDWTAAKLKTLDAEVELVELGEQTLPDGTKIALPKAILAQLGNDPNKKTICVYGHLDVQPALLSDGWDTEPFSLTEKDGKLYGRGAADDKGPVICWIHAIEGYKILGIPIPVNVKFVFEGMEETGSVGLAPQLLARKDTFFKEVDYVCISDSSWLTKTRPCISYGIRGNCYFGIEVQCAKKDLHSGVNGGTVIEAMADLIYLLDTLVDKNGRILIDGIDDDVAPLRENELKMYEDISFDVDEYRADVGANRLAQGEKKVPLLMANWRYPCLSIHGIEGAFSGSGEKTVIPHKVIGKFSIRTVPNQTNEQIERIVLSHLNAKWTERGSPNSIKMYMMNRADPWTENPNHPHYEAAKRAIKHVFKADADMTRAGGSIPITLTLKQATTDTNILLLPMRASDDGAHGQNEKFNIDNFITGTKLLGMYLHEIGQI